MSDKKKVIKKVDEPEVKSGLVQLKQVEAVRAVKSRLSAKRTVMRSNVKAMSKRMDQILINCRRGKVNPWDAKYLELYEQEQESLKKK